MSFELFRSHKMFPRVKRAHASQRTKFLVFEIGAIAKLLGVCTSVFSHVYRRVICFFYYVLFLRFEKSTGLTKSLGVILGLKELMFGLSRFNICYIRKFYGVHDLILSDSFEYFHKNLVKKLKI